MTRYRDVSLVLDDWLAEGARHAPDRVIDRVLTEVGTTRQRPPRPHLGRLSIDRFAGLSAAAVLIIAVAASIVLTLAQPNRPSVPPGGSASPVASPTASPTPNQPGSPMQSGVVYSVPGFQPSITLRDLPGWRLIRPAGASPPPGRTSELVLESPAGTRVVVMRPNEAIEAGGQPIIAATAFVDSWLWTRGELTFIRGSQLLDVPPPILVGGWPGRDLEGFVASDAVPNSHGQVVLLCAADYPCTADSEDQLAVRLGDHFRIVVLNVYGAEVVVAASTDPASWEQAGSDFTDLLSAVEFNGF